MQSLMEIVYHKAKPDPEVFLTAAKMLGIEPKDCVVFEDAVAGVQAAIKCRNDMCRNWITQIF